MYDRPEPHRRAVRLEQVSRARADKKQGQHRHDVFDRWHDRHPIRVRLHSRQGRHGQPHEELSGISSVEGSQSKYRQVSFELWIMFLN